MYLIIVSFLQKMSFIVAYMYFVLKLKNKMHKNFSTIYKYIAPILFSLLSVIFTYQPLIHTKYIIDLKGIPLFCIAYIIGWYPSIISLIVPILYCIHTGGHSLYVDILSLCIAWIIGCLFHKKHIRESSYSIIQLKAVFLAFICYEWLRVEMLNFFYHTSFSNVLSMVLFDAISVCFIFLMRNENSKNFKRERELLFHSKYDNMTQLYNLRHFKKRVEQLDQEKQPYVIAMFDIDYFKNFNDTYGHMAGDTVLRTIGQLLHDNMREKDIFARYGGEEFIICFSNVNRIKTAISIAERFRAQVANYHFQMDEDQPLDHLTISIGLSSVSSTKKLDELISEADKMLYKVKNAGRNNIAFTE